MQIRCKAFAAQLIGGIKEVITTGGIAAKTLRSDLLRGDADEWCREIVMGRNRENGSMTDGNGDKIGDEDT